MNVDPKLSAAEALVKAIRTGEHSAAVALGGLLAEDVVLDTNGPMPGAPTEAIRGRADVLRRLSGNWAVTMALRHIEVGRGGGQVIDLSLFEPLLSVLGPSGADYKLTGQVPERVGSRSPIMAPRNVYRCRDGKFVALSAAMQSMTEKLFQAIGRSELIIDPRFATNAARVSNVDTLDDIIAAFMADRTLEEALELFDAAGVTVGPVCTIADLLEHPFVREREVLISLPDRDMGEVPMHNVVPRLSASPGAIRSPAPRLGEHNAEILEALGRVELAYRPTARRPDGWY